MVKTLAEQHFDRLINERRSTGRNTYGKGLDHTEDRDWNQMALEEALDLAQYLAAENLRLREQLWRAVQGDAP
jgi:hypothetical protein